MRKLPPLRSLQAFEAAARLGSFKSAAAELHVSPTAISHQVRLLERTCGYRLFQRHPKPLELTGAGTTLYPGVRDGFDAIVGAVAAIEEPGKRAPLRVTSPNAFASRCLVPRLSDWRDRHPEIPLEIIGTDAVLDLQSGDADVAIRYARAMPTGRIVQEICRDTFFPVCSPALLASNGHPVVRAADLLRFPLIHYDWMNRDPQAPSWRQWLATAGQIDPSLSATDKTWALSFREELHAIDAVLAGQGVAICSNVVVGHELRSGSLVQAHPLSLPGYGFYLVALAQHVRHAEIEVFANWMRTADQGADS